MTQTLNPLYGDYINDLTLAKSAAFRPGFVVAPIFAQASAGTDLVAVTLSPDADLGFFAWKTRWIKDQGAFTFLEDAPISVTSLNTATYPNQLLVARWKWTSGPLDVNGHPTGPYMSYMYPVYQFEAAGPGDMAQGLIQSSIPQPDTNGRFGVVLGILNAGMFTFQNSTFIDLAYMSSKQIDVIQLDAAVTPDGTAHGIIPTSVTITGGSGKLSVTSNTGMSITFTAQKACSVAMGGSSFGFGQDDTNPGGGGCGYILGALKNGALIKQTIIWLDNNGTGIPIAPDVFQSVIGTSGPALWGNIVFPMTVAQLNPGDTLEIVFDDSYNFYHWIQAAWSWRMSLSVG